MPAGIAQIKITGDVKEALAALESLGVKFETVGKKADQEFGDKLDSVVSRASGGFSRIGNSLNALGLPFGEVFGKAGERIADADLKGKKFQQSMIELGRVTAIAGVAGIGVAASESINLADNFQKATAQIAANAGIPQKAADQIGKAFLDTAGKTTFSAQNIAQSFAPVAGQLGEIQGKALDSKQAMQFMSAAMDLAEGSGQNLGSTTSGLAKIMQEYGLNTGQAAQVADQLFNISKVTNQPIADLTQSIVRLKGRLGETAPQLSDIGTLLAFPQVASMGSRGIMTLNTAFMTLVGGTKPVNNELKAMGVHVFDAQGKFVGMRSIIEQMQPALSKMTQQQQLVAEKTLFGSSAAQLMGQIVLSGVPAYDKASAAISKEGAAHEAAEKNAATFHGTLEKLKSTGEDLGVKLGMILIPIVTKLGQKVAEVTNFLMAHKSILIAIGVIVGGVLTASIVAFTVNALQKFSGSIKDAGKGITTFAEKLGIMKTAEIEGAEVAEETGGGFGPIGMLVGLVVMAITMLVMHWKEVFSTVKAVADDVWHFLDGIWHSIDKSIREVWGGIESFFKQWWGLIVGVIFGGPIGLLIGLIVKFHKQIGDEISKLCSDVVNFFMGLWHDVTGWASRLIDDVVGFFTGLPGQVISALGNFSSTVINFFQNLPGDLASAASHMWDWIWAGLKDAEHILADMWNNTIGKLSFKIPSWIPGLGGHGFSMPQIPYMAAGGPVLGGQMYVVGDAGPELFIPSGGGTIIPSGPTQQILAGVGGTEGSTPTTQMNNEFNFLTNADANTIAQEVTWALGRLVG